jgi:hypothetical protein
MLKSNANHHRSAITMIGGFLPAVTAGESSAFCLWIDVLTQRNDEMHFHYQARVFFAK